MSVSFCGLELAHPIINGSGTFDAIAAARAFADDLREAFPFAAYVSKTITLEPRAGNAPPRLWETAAGLINSIGLPNKGLEGYLAEDLPQLAGMTTVPQPGAEPRPVPVITNVMGSTTHEFSALVEACEARSEIAALELNVSCPNVKTGLDIGADPLQLEQLVRAVRGLTRKPLIVKLTPNTADVAACAQGAQEGGADAVSLINTLRAMALAPAEREAPGGHRAWLGGRTGGLSGPAVRAVALAQVAAVAARVAVPVIGMGGVQSGAHARELMDVGATLVAVGTESFREPAAGARIARELGDTARAEPAISEESVR
ncbi:MAG TPA: dihydroorotate dehydrogenase [Solirubrobacteraceae bacterium]|nr:dihydroorotate dehydrogenase [Solirubrobacteraceae bacterium]